MKYLSIRHNYFLYKPCQLLFKCTGYLVKKKKFLNDNNNSILKNLSHLWWKDGSLHVRFPCCPLWFHWVSPQKLWCSKEQPDQGQWKPHQRQNITCFFSCNPIKHPCNNLALNEAHNVQFVSRLEGADSTLRGFSKACGLCVVLNYVVVPLCPPLCRLSSCPCDPIKSNVQIRMTVCVCVYDWWRKWCRQMFP